MNPGKYLSISILLLVIAGAALYLYKKSNAVNYILKSASQNPVNNPAPDYPLSIESMRKRNYPGSDLTIEQTLGDGTNYHQYIASYISDGLKIYGLLTVPDGEKPAAGWPVIIFNHGYIPPEQYRTTERYIAYVDAFARNGYIVFKSDYRGNGSSQGNPEGAYYSRAYTVDVLNALSTLKRYKDADPANIGMWGHSMGGNITLRSLVIDTKDIRAAVIWGGVVGSYWDLANNWQRRVPYRPSARELLNRNSGRQNLTAMYGPPATYSAFWNSIDPTSHIADITVPIQLHTGGSDEEVPTAFSQELFASLQKAGKIVEYYNYPGGDHNIASPNFEPAMQRSIVFFNTYLKK